MEKYSICCKDHYIRPLIRDGNVHSTDSLPSLFDYTSIIDVRKRRYTHLAHGSVSFVASHRIELL